MVRLCMLLTLLFLTCRFRPQAALHFLKKLIDGDALAPLLPTNSTLTKMSESAFHAMAKEWVEEAMTTPFVGKNLHEERDVHVDIAIE